MARVLEPLRRAGYDSRTADRGKEINRVRRFHVLGEEAQHAAAPSISARRDEYAEWVATTDPGVCLVDDPIQYWLLRRRQYPRLSRMAIDLFSVPAMPSEPERIFSLAGQMVTTQRGWLKADLIGAAQCISLWEKSEVIQISK